MLRSLLLVTGARMLMGYGWSEANSTHYNECGEPSRYSRIPGYHYWWYMTYKTLTIEVPWHAGIYRVIDGKFQQICGGTIISDRVIITAASCFLNVSSGESKSEEYRIAVGKLYHNWYKEEENAQLPAIDTIIPHTLFKGKTFNWAYDIALVKLKEALQMTRAVRPVCVDFEKIYSNSFVPGIFGVVVGWGGNTGWELRSEKLRKRTLPYVAFDVCEREVPSSFLPYLTVDKFCAGYLNGTGVCAGDGGGGFATEFADGKWYLMGIVSVGVPAYNADVCNLFEYTTYTRVSLFYDFIQKHLSRM